MSYSIISYEKIFEHNPFKKINTHTNSDHDLTTIDNVNKRVIRSNIKSEIISLYNDIVDKTPDMYDEFGKYVLMGKSDLEISQYQSSIINNIFWAVKVDKAIDVNITNEAIEIIMQCEFLHALRDCIPFILMFEHDNYVYTPRNVYDKIYGYFFRDEKNGFIDILRRYDVDNLPFKIKFKLLNPDDLFMPDIIFYNYQDTSYVNDIINNFIGMFTNFKISQDGHYNTFNACFINCFVESNDLNELNSLSVLREQFGCNTAKTNAYLMYAEIPHDITYCYEYIENIIPYLKSYRSLDAMKKMTRSTVISIKPKLTRIDKNVLSSNVNNLTLKIILSSSSYNSSFVSKHVLSDRGFSNKLINYIDDEFRKNNNDEVQKFALSEESFKHSYTQYYKGTQKMSTQSFNNAIKMFRTSRTSPKNSYIDTIEINKDNVIGVSYHIIM